MGFPWPQIDLIAALEEEFDRFLRGRGFRADDRFRDRRRIPVR